MTNQELFELMDRFSASGLTGLRLTQKDVSLELTRNGGAAPDAPAAACAPAGPEPAGKVLSAPLVGTYYAASAPDAAPFVTAGAQVSEGQTVEKGQAVGALGEELTMDFKLGSKSVNPWLLFQTSGGLFWKENG